MTDYMPAAAGELAAGDRFVPAAKLDDAWVNGWCWTVVQHEFAPLCGDYSTIVECEQTRWSERYLPGDLVYLPTPHGGSTAAVVDQPGDGPQPRLVGCPLDAVRCPMDGGLLAAIQMHAGHPTVYLHRSGATHPDLTAAIRIHPRAGGR